LISAAAILAPLLALVAADFACNFGAPGIWLAPIGLLCALLAAAEILVMLRANGHHLVAWTVYAGIAAIYLAACAPQAWPLFGLEYPPDCPLGKLGWPLAAATLAVGLAFGGEMLRYREPGGVIVNVSLAALIALYIGLSFAFVAELRFFHSNAWGMVALVSLLVVTKLSDVGAYTFGKCFGRHKLSPRLSPGKTIEGALGGIAVACGASYIFFVFCAPLMVASPPVSWVGSVLYGLLIALAGIVGDLSESLLKRDLQVKDSSRWLPGLGGVLDILDSVLASAPVAFVCWASGLIGPG